MTPFLLYTFEVNYDFSLSLSLSQSFSLSPSLSLFHSFNEWSSLDLFLPQGVVVERENEIRIFSAPFNIFGREKSRLKLYFHKRLFVCDFSCNFTLCYVFESKFWNQFYPNIAVSKYLVRTFLQR